MKLDLESIGLTQEEIQNRVVETIAAKYLGTQTFDEDGDPWLSESVFCRKLRTTIQTRIDDAISKVADKHVTPLLANLIEGVVLQQTNEWGEKKGEPVSFIEYLIQRTESYMIEKVDHNGKAKRDGDYNWSGKMPRIAHAVDSHLRFQMEAAMKRILEDSNKILVEGISEAAKTALGTIRDKLAVTVKA